ncbi:hypothetical protein B7767_19395 [Streptomyces sp. 13-12-16]|nr:hypothetical protein B7767_19395 [Streptomyces sp. 13-12-16]
MGVVVVSGVGARGGVDRSGAVSGAGFLPPRAVGEDGLASGTGPVASLAAGEPVGVPVAV